MKLKQIGNKTYFDEGNLSKCYLLDDGNVLKLFDEPKKLYEMQNFKYFMKYSNDSFLFPFEFIYDFRKFYGYIMPKALGKTLFEVFPNSNLLDLSKHSKKLEYDIDFVSEGGISLYDFHDRNVLYDGKKYSVIDPDEYAISNSISKVKEFNHKFHRILIGNLFLDNLENVEHTTLIRDNIQKYKYMIIRPSEMILEIKNDIESYYKEPIDTIDDVKKILRR